MNGTWHGAPNRNRLMPALPASRPHDATTTVARKAACRRAMNCKRTKIKLTDRISALKLIGQQHGMFKSETTVNGGTPIPVVLSEAEQLL